MHTIFGVGHLCVYKYTQKRTVPNQQKFWPNVILLKIFAKLASRTHGTPASGKAS